ncbi:hypothetical protein H5410_058812, partial [Solanum commersonii]
MIIRFFKMIIHFKFQMPDGENDEGSHKDQAAFLGKLGIFYREKAMEFKPPRFYSHQLNCLKLWRYVIRLGSYDRLIYGSNSFSWIIGGEANTKYFHAQIKISISRNAIKSIYNANEVKLQEPTLVEEEFISLFSSFMGTTTEGLPSPNVK